MTTRPRVWIISLKYAPGLKRLFVALGESLRRRGADARYLLAQPYAGLTDVETDGAAYLTTGTSVPVLLAETLQHVVRRADWARAFAAAPPDFACFYNFHPLNLFVLRHLKAAFPRCVTALYVHEPYLPQKRPYGRKQGLYIGLLELMQGATLRYVDRVILPSAVAEQRFALRHPQFAGKRHYGPFTLPDRGNGRAAARAFFTYIGLVHSATGFDVFVDLVDHCAVRDVDARFMAITPSPVDGYLERLSERARARLTLVNKATFSDGVLDLAMATSLAVFRLDREITQSAVVPVGAMYGTPAIVRDLPGFTQDVQHGYNGYVVPERCTPADIVEGMRYVQRHFPELSANARRAYEERWSEQQWDCYYRWLVNLLGL
ncbi:MAG: glycosyltransferase [Chloroflexi bacterium]|nr:glycosyltransferase [Chloroflexota bacterium]